MYGEFSQNKDIHVTSIRLKKKKIITNITEAPLILWRNRPVVIERWMKKGNVWTGSWRKDSILADGDEIW